MSRFDTLVPLARRYAAEWLGASAHGVALGALAGALSLGFDALASAPRSLPFAVVLGAVCGAFAGIGIGGARFITAKMPNWLAWTTWIVVGLTIGFVSAVGVGALEHLRGSRQRLAGLTLAVGCVGGAGLGIALGLSQSPALAAGRLLLIKRRALAGGLALLACAGVAAAPTVARWLLVYPLAMKVSVLLAFLLGCSAVGVGLELRLRAASGFGALVVAGAGLVGLALAPAPALGPLLATRHSAQVIEQLRQLFDADGDGFSGLFGGADCAPDDPRVHPRAREIPGNGVDDNCILGDAKPPPSASTPAVAPVSNEPSPMSVVLITIDALRADHTQPYGYDKPTTPNLARFAAGARRYERAYTAGGRTGLGLVALLGGVPVRGQSWKSVAKALPAGLKQRAPMDVVPAEWAVPPLPHWLRRRGMNTAAVLHFGAASWFTTANTLEPLFDHYAVKPERDDLPDIETVDAALEFLARTGEKPFFLWVHLFGPHEPHQPAAKPTPDFGPGIVGAYDTDIFQTDLELGRLLSSVDALQGPPRAIVITADHSEEFAGDRTFHAVDLFTEDARVPLLVRAPDLPVGVDQRLVSSIDIVPSVLAWTRTPAPTFPGFALGGPSSRSVALCDVFRPSRGGGFHLEQIFATDGSLRYVLDFESGREEFATVVDRGSAAAAASESKQRLKQQVLEYVEAYGPPTVVGGANAAQAAL